MAGLFITFEGTEGSGKSTQIQLLSNRLLAAGKKVLALREPGGTAIGEEVRQTLIHSQKNQAMTPEAELLLMNASRAQLVREVIRPALDRGEVVLCDRFHDSTIAYQGYGRGMDMNFVERLIDFAIGTTVPDLTLLLRIPLALSEERQRARRANSEARRDRFEEQNRDFFKRVEAGYDAIGAAGGARVRTIDATTSIQEVEQEIWRWVEQLIAPPPTQGERAWKTIGEYRGIPPGSD